jgi:protein-S-isoprenylcysteine O-methyltransferase Ste14
MKTKPPVYVWSALVAMLAAHVLVPLARNISFPWTLAGLIPLFSGAWLVFSALMFFRRCKTSPQPFDAPSTLVTNGPYSISRNPMYTGILLMLAGIAFLLGTVAPLLVVPVLCVVLDIIFIRSEEEKMETMFGDAYRRYKTKVRRWL